MSLIAHKNPLKRALQHECQKQRRKFMKIATSVRDGLHTCLNDEYGNSGFETMEILRNALPGKQ
jgi:hypothetical protein